MGPRVGLVYHANIGAKPAPNTGFPPTETAAAATTPICTLDQFLSAEDGTKCHGVTATGKKLYYCWTHGLGRNYTHPTGTCSNPAEGHKKNATLDNMMGGTNNIGTRKKKE